MAEEKTLEQLQEENENLAAENATLSQVNDDLSKKVEELSKKQTVAAAANAAQKKERPKVPVDVFEVEKNKYMFVSPVFTYKKKKITAADALKDTSLLAELVKAGSGVITKVK